VRLIATRDWDALTMSDIAESASVSKPLLYHYFSTKADLYIAAIDSAAGELRRVTRPDAGIGAAEELRSSLQAHLDWIDGHDLAYRAVMQGGMSGEPGVRRIVEQSRAEVVDRITTRLSRSSADPALRITIRGWIGFLEGACLDWLATKDLPKADLLRLLEDSFTAVLTSTTRRRSGYAPAPARNRSS